MLGEEKIIVQDRGIDAGIAALMQNANKGNMDPAALMAMMNNNYSRSSGNFQKEYQLQCWYSQFCFKRV